MANKTPKAVSTKRINFNESKKITDKLSFKSKAADYFIMDTELKGFWVKVTPSGGASYLVSSKPRGSRKVIRRTIGSTQLHKASEARAIARKWLLQIKDGIDPKAEVKKQQGRTQTLEQAFNDYIEMRTAAGKLGEVSVRNYRESMRNALKPLMKVQINALDDERVLDWYNKAANHSVGQAERARREMNAVCRMLVVTGSLSKNPVDIIKALGQRRTVKPRNTSLTTSEVGSVVNELNTFKQIRTSAVTQGNLWLFMLLTGLREGTLYKLKWSQVKLRDEVVIETTKNKESYTLPLIPLLNDILEQQRALVDSSPNPQCEYVFPNVSFSGAIVNPNKSLSRLYEMAGIDKTFTDHDMRRTFASIADLAGVSFTDIKHLMVHKKADITEQYMQSPQVKARKNYEAIAELVASEVVVATTYESVHYATVDLLRWSLFNAGKLARDPERNSPDFILDVSKAYYDSKQEQLDW